MNLIVNWRNWWQFWSVRLVGLQTLTIIAWASLPAEFDTTRIDTIFKAVVWLQGLLIGLARVVKQEKLTPTDFQEVKKP